MHPINGMAKDMAKALYDYAIHYLEENNLQYDPKKSISIEKLLEAAAYSYRDLERIQSDLDDKVSRQKFAAYHAFWFAKISPLANVLRKDEEGTEIVDVNERVATELAFHLVSVSSFAERLDVQPLSESEALETTGFQDEPVPIVWRDCPLDCIGQCFDAHSKSYLAMHEWQNFEYIVHSLRHRATGPYGLVNILEACATISCQAIHENKHPLLATP
jgi:hypothetical protein